MSMSISELHDQASTEVERGKRYIDEFVKSQMSRFEVAVLARFIESCPADTIETLRVFIDDPGAYSPNDFGMTRLMADWRDEMWSIVAEKCVDEGRSPVDYIAWHNEATYIGGQKAFDKALANTAAKFVAETVLDGLERYVIEKIDQRFSELTSGSEE